MKYAVEIATCGSLNKAAEKLAGSRIKLKYLQRGIVFVPMLKTVLLGFIGKRICKVRFFNA